MAGRKRQDISGLLTVVPDIGESRGDVLDVLADILIDIHESYENEQNEMQQAANDD